MNDIIKNQVEAPNGWVKEVEKRKTAGFLGAGIETKLENSNLRQQLENLDDLHISAQEELVQKDKEIVDLNNELDQKNDEIETLRVTFGAGSNVSSDVLGKLILPYH